MNRYLSAAMNIACIAALTASSAVFAGKPPKEPEAQPYLEGPLVNPDAEAITASAASGGTLNYGDNAGFIQHNIVLSNNQRSYVTVVCIQDDNVVYQASNWGADLLIFTMEDLAGQGLEWYEGTGPASCWASLIINEKKGKKYIITQVDEVTFDVM